MVDIIIVNYNAGQYLLDCIVAALKSTIPVNIIISDNGSCDNSLSLLESKISDPRLLIVKNQANLGFAKANNKVLHYTKYPYILFLNPDCIIEPTTLESLIQEMEKFNDIGMAGCLIQNLDGTEQEGCRRNIPTPWTAFIRAFGIKKLIQYLPKSFHSKYVNDFTLSNLALPEKPVFVEAISGAFMLVKRRILETVGTWDEGYFLHCEDLDWCMRIQQANYKILFVPTIKIMHIKGACSQTKPFFVQWHMHKGMIRFYRKFFTHQYSIFLRYAVFSAICLRFLGIVCLALFDKLKRKKKTFIKHN
ncbi:MAG: N-acetylglucosaminyl-diphospho-decaprenol L-rhamnosyltransferase [Legionellaceae bacterium]